jgi:hypothetical protein
MKNMGQNSTFPKTEEKGEDLMEIHIRRVLDFGALAPRLVRWYPDRLEESR